MKAALAGGDQRAAMQTTVTLFSPAPGGAEEAAGKFVQIADDSNDRVYLVFAPKSLCTYHAHIAERFFASRGIRGRFNSRMDRYEVAHPSWRIVGGGHWSMDRTTGRIELAGRSMVYGPFERTGVAAALEASDAFFGMSASVLPG